MGEVVMFPMGSRWPSFPRYCQNAESLSDLLHDRSKREAVLIETRIEQIRGDCGLSVYCNGRFKGVWLCRDRAYDWVPPSFLHAICRAPNANAAVEHTLLWLEA